MKDLISEVYPVSRETFQRFELLNKGVLQWQIKTNLISNATKDTIWERHIADSLQCIALKPDTRTWIDIGSGGGFPGLVIAAVMADFKESDVQLIESNAKKCAFLRQMNRQMGGKAIIHNERIESVAKQIKPPEIVTARALAPLSGLLGLASPWLQNGTIGLFHKGREFEAELEECNGLWEFDLVNHRSKISPDSVILEVTNLQGVSS